MEMIFPISGRTFDLKYGNPLCMCSSRGVQQFHRLLTPDEVSQICDQFHQPTWQRGCQVMWSGVPRYVVQTWADKHGMQTLTTAMGPLMDHTNPQCSWSKKSQKQWSRYMKGASAVYAYHIAQDEGKVTVLSPAPTPDGPSNRFNPFGGTNYQTLEAPILKGRLGSKRVTKIEIVHPMVRGAEEFRYELWPVDEVDSWHSRFGYPTTRISWRHAVAKRSLL